MWNDIVQSDRPEMTISLVHIACWTPKAANTDAEYVVLIAFALQKSPH
jgi:hypothetical protein